MLLKLVINRSGGTFRRLKLAETIPKIEKILVEAGHTVSIDVCRRRELDISLNAALRDPQFDAVVVGGGDGTILSAIVVGLGQTKPLGILPLGTLNLLARDLGINLDPFEAAAQLTTATATRIDLAEVNGLPFAIWASLGMHPWIVRRRDKLQAQGLSKWPAFVMAAFRAVKIAPFVDVTISANDQADEVRRTPIVVISNNAWEDGPLPLMRKTLDSGTLTVHVAKIKSRFGLLWLALNSLFGNWRSSAQLESFSASQVKISARSGKVIMSLDGEVTLARSPLLFRSRPGALNVLMPRSSIVKNTKNIAI